MSRSLVATLLLATASAVAGAAGNDDIAVKHFAALRSQLDPRAQVTLDRMDGLGRQLLAARGYLRAGSTLDQRWSWTQQQIDAWPGSPAQIALDIEIDKVRTAFEKAHPGYTLFVNPQVRSIDLQLQRWNETDSITRASDHIVRVLRAAVREPGFPSPGSAAATERFRELVTLHAPQPIPTLATPGLSAHGRMSAVDFQVKRGNRIVAGPDSSSVESVWIAKGWRDRVQAAVLAAGGRFKGPLVSPAEPWHYDYQP